MTVAVLPTPASRTLLIAVRDAASAMPAVQRALALARPGVDRVHLLHVQPTGVWERAAALLPGAWWTPEAEGVVPDWLTLLARRGDAAGVQVTAEQRSGDAAEQITTVARALVADLILVAAPRDSLAREVFLGSTATHVLRTAPCPVLVCRSDPAGTPSYARVMLSLDPEHDTVSHRLLASARTWLEPAEWHVAHAYRVPEEHALRRRGASEEQINALRIAMAESPTATLQTWVADLPGATLHVEHGYPSSVLLDLCERLKPDVMMIGKHRGSDRQERLLGSVTQFLVYACRCDVWLVG